MEKEVLRRILEAFLLVNHKPLPVSRIREALDGVKMEAVHEAFQELQAEYEGQQRGFRIAEIAGGFQLCTAAEVAPWLKKLQVSKQKVSFSRPALETLAIIAYKQPLVRAEIEFIRGVNVDGVLRLLLEHGLIKITGRRDSPGRPLLYGTTDEFLLYFGLKSLQDLPKLAEFTEADIKLEVDKLIEQKEGLPESGEEGTTDGEVARESTDEPTGTD